MTLEIALAQRDAAHRALAAMIRGLHSNGREFATPQQQAILRDARALLAEAGIAV